MDLIDFESERGINGTNALHNVTDLANGGTASPGDVTEVKRTTTLPIDHLFLPTENNAFRTSEGPREDDNVIINVGGVRHETRVSTLKNAQTNLADDKFMSLFYRRHKGDYFFDRHPAAFAHILNYHRTGELHVPKSLCGPMMKLELDFWGVDENRIRHCCWNDYCVGKLNRQSLERLEQSRQREPPKKRCCLSCWHDFSSRVWAFLDDPYSSRPAMIYAWIAMGFVFLSIFAFCAETHPAFHVEMTNEDWVKFYGEGSRGWDDYFYEYDFSDYIYDYFGEPLPSPETRGKRDTHAQLQNQTNKMSSSVSSDRIKNNTTSEEARWDKLKLEINKDKKNAFKVHPLIIALNYLCLFYFSLEIVVRFIFCPNHIKFFLQPMNIIDIVAILPSIALLVINSADAKEYYTETAWDSLSVFGIIRVFRIFRMMKQYTGLQVLVYTLRYSIQEILLLVVFMCIGMVLFSSIMYFAEKGYKASMFPNIFAGFWWAVVTMTTVGYGDMVPKSGFGHLVGSCSAVCGVLVVALCVPVLVNNFELFYTFVRSRPIEVNSDMRRRRDRS